MAKKIVIGKRYRSARGRDYKIVSLPTDMNGKNEVVVFCDMNDANLSFHYCTSDEFFAMLNEGRVDEFNSPISA